MAKAREIPELHAWLPYRDAAAATVRAELRSGGVLMLCGHHGRRHAPALRAQDAQVSGELPFATRT